MRKDKKETWPRWKVAWECDGAAAGRMNRHGRIGRLPRGIREELNCRLQDGERGAPLARWLNGLPETKAALARDSGLRKVTLRNLLEWQRGGYRDWRARQDLEKEIARQFLDWAQQQPVQDELLGRRLSYFEMENESRRILGLRPLTRKDIPPGEDWDAIPPRLNRKEREAAINQILRIGPPDDEADEDKGTTTNPPPEQAG